MAKTVENHVVVPAAVTTRWLLGLVGLLLMVGCSGTAPTVEDRSPSSPTLEATPSRTPTPTALASPSTTKAPDVPRRPVLGVDVSHHKGTIDWQRVRADGISFAYLKASEGAGFTDPRFADNLRGAQSAGVRAGGYHYFTLCGEGSSQAEHFLAVIGKGTTMPPAVDVEFNGNCQPGPPREALLIELRAFIDTVEARTGKRMVVYLYPELEEHYRIADDLDRRQWVRSLDGRPSREWWLWQKSDSAQIDGISSPADLNQLR
ncbi:MAG: GH25 family lysozyme [Nocardioides sp.]|nr:GH25 family lysozyme [Nocardioides sp.]